MPLVILKAQRSNMHAEPLAYVTMFNGDLDPGFQAYYKLIAKWLAYTWQNMFIIPGSYPTSCISGTHALKIALSRSDKKLWSLSHESGGAATASTAQGNTVINIDFLQSGLQGCKCPRSSHELFGASAARPVVLLEPLGIV